MPQLNLVWFFYNFVLCCFLYYFLYTGLLTSSWFKGCLEKRNPQKAGASKKSDKSVHGWESQLWCSYF